MGSEFDSEAYRNHRFMESHRTCSCFALAAALADAPAFALAPALDLITPALALAVSLLSKPSP